MAASDFQADINLAFDRINGKLNTLRTIDATKLMVTWREIIWTDNRDGILAGTDKDGYPMRPVTYRPVAETVNIRSKSASGLRHGQHWKRMKDLLFAGRGTARPGLHNNLSTSEYRRLTGPPLAPRFQFSRSISNLKTAHAPLNPEPGNRYWVAWGEWDEVVAKDGMTEFLLYHFNGDPLGRNGPQKRRDLRGVRPEGMRRAHEALEHWMKDVTMAILTK